MNIVLAFAVLTGVTMIVLGQPMERGNSIAPFSMRGKTNGNSISPGQVPSFRIRMDVDGLQELRSQLIPFSRVGKRIPFMMPMYIEPTTSQDKYASQYAPSYDSQTILTSGFSASDKQDNNIGIVKKDPATPNAGGGMWFGPRLGK